MLIEVTSLVEVDIETLREHVVTGFHPHCHAPMLDLLDSLEAGDWEAFAEKAVEGHYLLSSFPHSVQTIARGLIERKRLERLFPHDARSMKHAPGGKLALNYPRLEKIEAPQEPTK